VFTDDTVIEDIAVSPTLDYQSLSSAVEQIYDQSRQARSSSWLAVRTAGLVTHDDLDR
jgi:hypothetical protein